VGACDVNIGLHPDDADADMRLRRSADRAGRIAVPPHDAARAENRLTILASVAVGGSE
jgi:hypothetical protein